MLLQYYHHYLNAKRSKDSRHSSCAFCLNRIVKACIEHAEALHDRHTIAYHDSPAILYTDQDPESAAARLAEPLDQYCADRDALNAYLEALPDGKNARFYLTDADGKLLAEVLFPLYQGIPDHVVGEETDDQALHELVEDVFRVINRFR